MLQKADSDLVETVRKFAQEELASEILDELYETKELLDLLAEIIGIAAARMRLVLKDLDDLPYNLPPGEVIN